MLVWIILLKSWCAKDAVGYIHELIEPGIIWAILAEHVYSKNCKQSNNIPYSTKIIENKKVNEIQSTKLS